MQPINHWFLLLNTRIPLPVIRTQLMRPQRQLLPLFRTLGEILLNKPTPDKQKIPNLNISPLCLRPNINPLLLPTSLELSVGYAFGFVGVE